MSTMKVTGFADQGSFGHDARRLERTDRRDGGDTLLSQQSAAESFVAQDPNALLLAETLKVLQLVSAQNDKLSRQLEEAQETNRSIAGALREQKAGPVRFAQLSPERQQQLKDKLQTMSCNGRLFVRGHQHQGGGFVEDPTGGQLKRITSGGAAARLDHGKPVELVELTRMLDSESHSSYQGEYRQKYLWSMDTMGFSLGGSRTTSERGFHQEDRLMGEWFASPVNSWEFLDWEDKGAQGLPGAGLLQEGEMQPIEELNIHQFQNEDSRSWGLLFGGGANVREGDYDLEHLHRPGQEMLESRNPWKA